MKIDYDLLDAPAGYLSVQMNFSVWEDTVWEEYSTAQVFLLDNGWRLTLETLLGEDYEKAAPQLLSSILQWCQDNGIEVIPLRSSLPDKCFSYLESTGEMIVITKGEKGYTPTGIYPQDSSPKEGVAAANEANGVTKAQEAAMVAGSMFGWHVPNADPKNYDEHGKAIRPKAKDRDNER